MLPSSCGMHACKQAFAAHLPAHVRDEHALGQVALQQRLECVAVLPLFAPPLLLGALLLLALLLLQVPAPHAVPHQPPSLMPLAGHAH